MIEAIEKALLDGNWPESLECPPDDTVAQIARRVSRGDFSDLKTSPSRDLFSLAPNAEVSRPLAEWFTVSEDPSPEAELLRLTCAVACLHAFLQANWTGPDLAFTPLELLPLSPELAHTVTDDFLHQKAIAELACGGEPAYHLARAPAFLLFARILLGFAPYSATTSQSSSSSPSTNNTNITFKHCRSATWWRLRVWRVHEQVLDEAVAPPADIAPAAAALLQDFASPDTEPDLAGRLELELGLLAHVVGDVRTAASHFVRAARATRLEYELTGAPGRRTKFQDRDITQLVLLAESRARGGEAATDPVTENGTRGGDEDTEPGSGDAAPLPTGVGSPGPAIPETLPLNDDTLLEQTAFTSSAADAGKAPADGAPASSSTSPTGRLAHIDPGNQPALHPLDQAILLALCLNVKNTSPAHGLTAEQMMPYVARTLAHPRNWAVHTLALLLRARLQASRTRTVERSVLQLQALVDQLPTADAPPPERLRYAHALVLPPRWEMERELAERYLSLGVVRSALAVFERLELWADAVRCHAALEQPAQGVALVRDLLTGAKTEADAVLSGARASNASPARQRVRDAAREAKLWCLLGDLEPARAAEHYTTAWAASGATSARAMRSLGGLHFARGEYGEAIGCLERAVALAPLQARAWFVLGCAALRVEDWARARGAFARCVRLDDEDGESWNNLASVYMRMGEAGEEVAADDDDDVEDAEEAGARDRRVPLANRLRAFRALREGLRASYDSWRMWANYTVVAADVGELGEACRALARVVEARADRDGAGAVDADVLDRLVDAAVRELQDPDAAQGVAGGGDGDENAQASDAAARGVRTAGLPRRVDELFTRTILPRVASARISRARARLLAAQGRPADALAAHMDAYRLGPAGAFERGETDAGVFRAAVDEVADAVDVLRNFGPRADADAGVGDGQAKAKVNWKLQARSVVRTFVGRARDFEDEPEWARLGALLEEIKNAEE
ncbi:TPR-like protein [Epithele typhae]|uniref:TPR-like protein n=1 Tax=Epithele typhae TaxID=378194 RepID=UPI002008CB31|nr:TPR-like protein [Epithele typhae]KAH9939307.1 TPR-like protein [Epithele typhae]